MNPSLLAAFAAACLAGLWLGTRRRPRPFLRSGDTSAVAALNRAQIAQLASPESGASSAALADPNRPAALQPAAAADPPVPEPGPTLPPLPPAGAVRQRLALLRQLELWSHGGGSERLQAMALARLWRHPCVLPLLRRGLRDPDPRVMAEAAAAIEAFRGCRPVAGPQASGAPASSRPRRMLRTR